MGGFLTGSVAVETGVTLVSALLGSSCVVSRRSVAVLDEAFFFELAGLATTFRFETGLVFFAVDFLTAAFVFVGAAFFLEVFFEVPFFPDVLVVFRALFDDRPTFLRLAAAVRLVDAFREVFPAVLLLPVFFFFLVAAFLPGIQLASKSNYTKPAIIHMGGASGSLFARSLKSPRKAAPAGLPVLHDDRRIEPAAHVELGRQAQETRGQPPD